MIVSTHGFLASTGSVLPFEFTVKTDNAGVSTSTQFRMPLTTSTGLNINVDWGDFSPIENITIHTNAIHTYTTAGTYTISVTGSFTGFLFNSAGDRLKILNINSWGVFRTAVNQNGAFHGCSNLTCTAIDAPLEIRATSDIFRSCPLFNGAIGNWRPTTGLQRSFNGASVFNQDISNWNTSTFTTFGSTFDAASAFNQPIGKWNTSSVTGMGTMFRNAVAFNQDISSWDITKVTNFLNFMQGATLSTSNYDLLLVGWEATLQSAFPSGVGYTPTINIHFGGSKYTALSAAAAAHTRLVSLFNWTITDGGPI